MSGNYVYVLVPSPRFERILRSLKRKKQDLFRELEKRLRKILEEPTLGKPLRNVLGGYRRVHIGSFVLIYKLYQNEIRLLDFDHHDRIYKKH